MCIDTNEAFNVIVDAESAIKIRKNATTYRCSRRRRQEVREYMKLGYKKWAKKVKYGLRWAIEGIFSSIKRKFGEDLRGRSLIGLLAEAMQKGSIRTSTKSVLIVLHKLAPELPRCILFHKEACKELW